MKIPAEELLLKAAALGKDIKAQVFSAQKNVVPQKKAAGKSCTVNEHSTDSGLLSNPESKDK